MGCCMCEHTAKTAFVDSEDLLNRFTGELSFGGGAVNQVNVHLFVLTKPFGGSEPTEWGTIMPSTALTR